MLDANGLYRVQMDVLVQQVLGVPGIVKLKGQLPLRDWYSARGGAK